jgi:hypothetical protein
MINIETNMMIMNVEMISVIQEAIRPTAARRMKDTAINIQYISNLVFFM